MKKMKWYLVGPIQWAKDFMSWREDAREELEELGHEAIFPWGEIFHGKKGKAVFSDWAKVMDHDEYLGRVRKYMRRYVIKWDIKAVEACDGIVFWLPKDVKTVGSHGEATLIYYFVHHKRLKKYRGRHKKIFIISDIPLSDLSNWTIGCSDRIFKSWNEFWKYMKDNFNRNGKKKI